MANADKATDEARIRALLDAWADAIRAKDTNGSLSPYAPDVVRFLLEPPLRYTGVAALDKAGLEQWFRSFRGQLGYEIRDLGATVGDDVAFCHSLNRMRGTKADGEDVDLWLRTTLGFRKIDGEWRITHEHESVPFYMDGSYKAAVDLKP